MLKIILAIIFITWGSLFVYFVWRYVTRRRPQSMVVAFSCLGWPLFIAREMHWLQRTPAVPFVAAALTGGVLGFLVVAVAEAQRVHPFR